MRDNLFRQELLRQARKLVFNKASDAAALAFRGDSGGAELEGLDLSAVSSIHRMANGSVELKFIDRIKLIELLLAAGDDRQHHSPGDGFIQALDRAAMRLGGQTPPHSSEEFAAGELDLPRERRAADVGGAARGAAYGGAGYGEVGDGAEGYGRAEDGGAGYGGAEDGAEGYGGAAYGGAGYSGAGDGAAGYGGAGYGGAACGAAGYGAAEDGGEDYGGAVCARAECG